MAKESAYGQTHGSHSDWEFVIFLQPNTRCLHSTVCSLVTVAHSIHDVSAEYKPAGFRNALALLVVCDYTDVLLLLYCSMCSSVLRGRL